MTEDEFAAELRELCVETAPRRFAICAVRGEYQDGVVVGWGMALDGERAVVCHAQTRAIGRFRSAEGAYRLFARSGPVRLIWIDPTPDPDNADLGHSAD